MDPQLVLTAVTTVMSLVEALLPSLGVAGSSVTVVDTIINALVKIVPVLEKLAPVFGNEIALIYQGIKNIIANIRGTDTTAEQDAALDSLDTQVDASWNSVAAKFDPDFVQPPAAT